MRILFVALLGLAGVASAVGSTCQNPGIWDEGDLGQGDAGKMPNTANVTIGSGALTRICGNLANPGNGVDMYEILVTDTFTAQTHGRGATPIADPALYLFDVNGNGLLANNDICGCTTQAGFFGVPLIPGLYFLAIVVDNQEPLNKNGKLIFGDITGTTGPMLPLVKNTKLDSWTNGGVTNGLYFIDLAGAQFAQSPEPAALILTAAGIAGIALRRRK